MAIALTRTLILYVAVIVALRLMGKRQVGEMQPTELVITILVSELAAVPMQDYGIPLLAGIVPIFTLISAEILLSYAELKWIPLRSLLNGNPVVMIEHGKIQEKKLRQMRLTVDELLEQLRIHNINNISDIRFALMETNGQMSFVPEPGATPVTADMVGFTPAPSGVPVVLISDGRLVERNLRALGQSEAWLEGQLKGQGVSHRKSVLLMTADECGNVWVQRKEGKG